MKNAERFKLVPAVSLILKKNDKILFNLRRNAEYCSNCWGLIGGGVDRNETIRQGALREAKEEVGITLKKEDLQIVHALHWIVDGDECITFFIVATSWQGEPTIMEPHKCAQLAWFDIDTIPSNTIPYLKPVLIKINKGIFYSEWGWQNTL